MEDRTNVLRDKAQDLRSLAEALEMAAEILQQRITDPISPEDHQPEVSEPKPEPEVKEVPVTKVPLTLIDVRKILAEKSRAGYTSQVRLLLEKYGADKLSAIDPLHYQNLIDEAKCLGATLDDIKVVIAKITQGRLEKKIPAVFEHHFATSLDDLKPENYTGCLRDLKGLQHE